MCVYPCYALAQELAVILLLRMTSVCRTNTRKPLSKGRKGMDRFKSVYARCWNALQAEKAQAVVEYALILLLIAIVVVAMLKGIGGKTNTMYSTVNSAFSS
jgi:pilus assembly protein Flp/PilA